MKENQKNNFLSVLKEAKGIITLACDSVGISRRTYYNWINSDEYFKEECQEIIEHVIDLVEAKLLSNINAGDTTAMIFYLKTKGKSRGYVEQIDHSHFGAIEWKEEKTYESKEIMEQTTILINEVND